MHYYNKNIGDFNNATRHLTRQERSIYSDLIELQYDLETPIPNDLEWICRKILAVTESERTDVERTLNEFFDLVEQGWSNGRCEREIAAFDHKRQKAITAGKLSGAARRRNKTPKNINKNNRQEHAGTNVERTLNGTQTDVEPNNKQETRNNKQEPNINITPSAPRESKPQLNFSWWPEQPSPQILKDWIAMRKGKKAPVSQTVINRYAKQLELATKAGYSVDECLSLSVTKGWLDFKFEWFLNEEKKNANQTGQPSSGKYQTAAERTDAALATVFGPAPSRPLEGELETVEPLEADPDANAGSVAVLGRRLN